MAFDTYSSLQTSVANYMARSDLTSPIIDSITLFEAETNRTLRVRQQMATQSTTPSSGQFSLPSDYLQWVRVTWAGTTKRELDYVHPSILQGQYPDTPTAIPQVFTVEGSTDNLGIVRIMPTDTTPVDFTYYQKVSALSTSNTANWLLSAHPDAYLFGALAEINTFLKDFDTAAVWKTRRDDIFDRITKLDQKTRGPSFIHVQGRTP